MNNTIDKITGGLYLVIDPAKGEEALLPTLQHAITGGVDIVQVWNHWQPGQDKPSLVMKICALAHARGIPVLINEDWRLLRDTSADGVHFDELPDDLPAITKAVARRFLVGITCGNDLSRVLWAEANHIDYISFCSLFPSASAGACELINIATVQAARQLTSLPIFLAGGITPDNLPALAATPLNGIAVIGGILNSADPASAAANYKQTLQQLKQT